MSDWKTNFPRNVGPNRSINDDATATANGVLVAEGLKDATGNVIVARPAFMLQAALYNMGVAQVPGWADTSLPAPYSATVQPHATVSGNNVTVTTTGSYTVFANDICSVTGGVGPYATSHQILVNGLTASGIVWTFFPSTQGSAALVVSELALTAGDVLSYQSNGSGFTAVMGPARFSAYLNAP